MIGGQRGGWGGVGWVGVGRGSLCTSPRTYPVHDVCSPIVLCLPALPHLASNQTTSPWQPRLSSITVATSDGVEKRGSSWPVLNHHIHCPAMQQGNWQLGPPSQCKNTNKNSTCAKTLGSHFVQIRDRQAVPALNM